MMCEHLETRVGKAPGTMRRHGVMWIERIWCDECQAAVTLRTFDDPRDDHSHLLPPDGPATATRKEP
jgi:hypothetical protein